MRLIDADALMEKFCYRLPHEDVIAKAINACVDAATQEVMNAPTIDAVPVVRCKDCKHMEKWDEDCYMCQHGRTVRVKPDHFCSYGERRSND